MKELESKTAALSDFSQANTDARPRTPVPAYLVFLFLSVLSYYLVSRFLFMSVVVQGRSMSPTLLDGDRCLLNRAAFWFRQPLRGDVVVVRDVGHSDLAVKRIIGLPGETIEFREGSVFINRHLLPEPYLYPGVQTSVGRTAAAHVKLGDQHYFVLGDNRPTSQDSRSYGPLEREKIVGLIIR